MTYLAAAYSVRYSLYVVKLYQYKDKTKESD